MSQNVILIYAVFLLGEKLKNEKWQGTFFPVLDMPCWLLGALKG
jgi:hypothetical protein